MKKILVFTLTFIFLFSNFLLASSLLQSLSKDQKKKLDASLQTLLSDSELTASRLIPVFKQSNKDILIPVLVKARQDLSSEVENLNGFIGSQHGNIYTVYLPQNEIPNLAKLPYVSYIEGAKLLKPELDTSLLKNGASFLHNVPHFGIRGQGVIIGVTDSGIDLTHPDFKDSLGNTRILYLWDQYSNSGNPPPEFSYGSEYDHLDLLSGNVVSNDYSGHGTRVAGIAAGNGYAGQYVGMAPEAKLIIVKTLGGMLDNIIEPEFNSAGLLDAYAYIRKRANQIGLPYVINTSRGTTIGPHDGSTLLSQAVNAEVSMGSIIVVSAGNYANDDWHAETVAQPNQPSIFRLELDEEEKSFYVNFWYNTNDLFQLEIVTPAGNVLAPVSKDTVVKFYEDEARVQIVSQIHSPLNGDNEFLVKITTPLAGGDIADGIWFFRLITIDGNTLPDGGEIDAWMLRDTEGKFVDHVDPRETIGELATSDSVISVASFNNKRNPMKDISNFSSLGPRRDGVLKPDIAAAGGSIVAARSQQSDDTIYQGKDYYAIGSGTSYSAPHIVGAVALLLQMDPNLSAGQIKNLLALSAKQDQYTGATPNTTWGYGKLDVIQLLKFHLTTLEFQGKILYNSEPISATLQFKPFGIENSDLAKTVFFTSNQDEFSTSLLSGTYELTITPNFPFVASTSYFEAPLDSLFLYKDFEVDLANVLLIDDDSLDYETYYSEALESLEMKYSIWQDTMISAPPLKSTAKLLDNPIVIWFTGDNRDSVLTVAERDTIQNFLLNGGRLLLTGQNILESIDSTEFANQFLQSRFVGNTNDHVLHGVSTDTIMGGFPFLLTTGGFGAKNQNSSDILDLTGAGTPIAYYDTTAKTIAGVRIENSEQNWRLIFLGFGLEAVTAPPNRNDFISREQFLTNAIDWLAGTPIVSVQQQDETKNKLSANCTDDFSLFPNPLKSPATEFITVQYRLAKESQEVVFSLYNLLGKKVKALQVDQNEQNGILVLNIRDDSGARLPTGIYFLVLNSGGNRLSKKLLVLH